MEVCQTIEQMRRLRPQLAEPSVLVPTMGALHDGHLAHIHQAWRYGQSVVVSIFVNPTQFGPDEDYEKYPRALDRDLERCRELGVDAVFAPPPEQLYPPGQVAASVDVPELAREFEAAQRPGHFAGVCRVVAKLIHITQPTHVTFGQKDYQQLVVCQAMLADLAMAVTVIGVPTVRDSDGLALSSRNRYLDAAKRPRALGLIHALQLAQRMIGEKQSTDPTDIESAMGQTIHSHGLALEYSAIRDPATLEPIKAISQPVVALVAGRLGDVRLLDNAIIDP